MALTTDQQQEVIDLRIAGLSIRAVAERTSHAPQTVQRVWRDYLRERSEDRSAEIEAHHQELIERFMAQAQEAREEALVARRDRETREHRAYLREERDALREVIRLTGLDAPMKVNLTGDLTVGVSVEETRGALTDYLVGLCQSPN
jgi:hypothetical protein